MHKELFTINLLFSDGSLKDFSYSTLNSCLHDKTLEIFFNGGHIKCCAFSKNGKRITSLSSVGMTWEHFTIQIKKNAMELLFTPYEIERNNFLRIKKTYYQGGDL